MLMYCRFSHLFLFRRLPLLLRSTPPSPTCWSRFSSSISPGNDPWVSSASPITDFEFSKLLKATRFEGTGHVGLVSFQRLELASSSLGVGVSGGPDSYALCFLLHRLN